MDRAEALARLYPETIPMQSWEAAVSHENVEVVIVAIHSTAQSACVTLAALQAGDMCSWSKPAARHYEELDAVVELAEQKDLKVRTGFNLQIPPRHTQSKKDRRFRRIGQLMFIRGRYGHGGRPG
ncbi:MAG: Gfo/Idh/MocA family oxidoreductase [Candidatus Obscuribacterales bacterium]